MRRLDLGTLLENVKNANVELASQNLSMVASCNPTGSILFFYGLARSSDCIAYNRGALLGAAVRIPNDNVPELRLLHSWANSQEPGVYCTVLDTSRVSMLQPRSDGISQ